MARDHCKLRYHSLHGLIFLGLFAFLHWNMNRTVIAVSMAWGNMSSMDRKVASRQSPGRMLYAAKIDDRHLSEQKLLEMAAFYTWLDFTLTDMHRSRCISLFNNYENCKCKLDTCTVEIS